jgi:Co/Zn/Cd efflux system component
MEPRTAPAGHAAEVRTLMTACALTFLFFLVELVGGMVAGSLAIMSEFSRTQPTTQHNTTHNTTLWSAVQHFEKHCWIPNRLFHPQLLLQMI